MQSLVREIEEALQAGRSIRSRKEIDLKIYYGCGKTRQPGYINIDVRNTEATDIVTELPALAVCLKGCCSEVYMSHVLEHFASPGKAMRKGKNDILGAILLVKKMLKPSGILRIAVPNFRVLCQLYISGEVPLYPKILGRISGEQEYPENLHKCVFDKKFLEFCLSHCGFDNIQSWDPMEEGFNKDSSFDQISGINTSLNLKATKKRSRLKRFF